MAVTREQVAELYVATFNRAPLSEGLDYWTSSDFSIELIASCFFEQDEAQALYTDGGEAVSSRELVLKIFDNIFDRLPKTAGLEYWMDALDSGTISQGEMILSIMNGISDEDDAAMLANKTEVALYYAEHGPQDDTYSLEGITADEASVTAALAEIDAMDPDTGTTYPLTADQDLFEGTANDDTFFADVVQVDGVQVNSLATGDNLQGGAGEDILEAQVTEGAYVGGTNMAIQPRTNSIETVELEALDSNLAADVNSEVYVNAKNMLGVESLWSLHSEANLTIQNLTTQDNNGSMRSLSEMTIGMGYSGNDDTNWDESDLNVYFDQDYLNPDISLSDQVVAYRIMNEDAYDIDPDAPLDGVYVARLEFELNGVSYDLADYLSEVEDPQGDGTEITTYTELRDQLRIALESLIADNPDVDELATMEIELGGSFTSDNNRVGTEITFTIPGTNADGEANTLEVSPFFAEIRPAEGDDAIANSNRYERSSIEGVEETQELRINVALEKVGLAAGGGDLAIGSMAKDETNTWNDDTAAQGIEIFDVTVYGDESKPSSLDSLRSTNNTLKEVNVVSEDRSDDSYADLTIGNGNADADIHDGLKDVQTFNAEEFQGNLDITVNLTNEIMDKYLVLDDDAADYTADNVDFVYTGGIGDDTMTFTIDGEPVAHEDFSFAVDSGDGDDIINTQINFFNTADDSWEYGDHKALDNLSIDTGAGDDVVRTVGDGDFTINTGSGDDTVYTNNDGLLNGDALVNEVQVITFGEAGDLNTQGNVTVTLSNGAAFTVTTILTDDTAATVATKVAAAINAQDAGVNVLATANGSQVELQYTDAYINAQTATNGDVGMATVEGLLTDVTMAPTVVTTPAVPGTAEAAATVETAVITTAGILDGSASDTLTFSDGTVVTLVDTDGNGTVTAFEIAEQIAASNFTDYTVTDSNPSIGTVNLTANTAGNVADLTVAVAGVTAPVIAVTQGADAVAYAAGTAEVQTLTMTNGADQAGIVTMGVDVDADGTIQADELFNISVGAGNQADVAADIAAGINALTGVSATHAANSDDVVVTWDSDLFDPAAITMVDGAVRSVSVAEETKGRMASATTATWVLNADNREIDDLSGTDVSADAIIYNSTVTITLSGATFGSRGDDVTNAAADAYDNGFEATATIPTSGYLGNEYNLNQAIKDAIQNDTVMNMLLDVEDGPEDTLIITSKVDGKVLNTDLAIEVKGPASLSTADLAALNLAYKELIQDSDAADLSENDMLALINANLAVLDDGYASPVLATDEGVELAGFTSVSESDNIINLGSGDDLVVLGTDAESNDTIKFTGSDIGTNAIFNFVADGSSGATDYLDFSAYLTNVASASGSTRSETEIPGGYLFNASALNENDVVFINDFAADAVNGETWDNLTAARLLTAVVNTNNTDYGSIDSADLDVSNADANLVGNNIKNIILVENDKNDGEYKVFEATSSASADEFTSISLLGKVDFGETITTMSIDDGLDNDGGQDNDGVVVPANTTYANAGTGAVMIGTSSSDTFVVVGQVTDADYIAGATNGTKAVHFADAVNAIENGVGGGAVNSNDYYNGGSGTDTMEIWGNVNFTNATLDNIEVFDIHSTVTFRLDQLEGATVNTQDESVVSIDTDGNGMIDVSFQGDDLDDLQDYIDAIGEDPNANTPPVAADDDDAFEVAQGASEVSIDVADLLGNDYDDDNDDLTIISVDPVTGGTPELSDDGLTITFTVDADFEDTEVSFQYTLFDGTTTDTAIVTGTVIETPLEAADDENVFTIYSDASYDIDVSDLLANDGGDDLTITGIDQVTGGTAVLSEDGETITFTAGEDFTGPASFVYTVSDGTGTTDTATVTGTVVEEGEYTDVELSADGANAGTEGVAERFIYEIDSSTGAVLSAEGADIELTGFTIGEDLLLFDDVETGTTTTGTFTDDVTVSASGIFNVTDIVFDADADGNGYKLILAGVADGDLSEVDFIVG